jgi:diguanylate cyclase (GGDEF)-like protein/PAS domain S-box-containing protein
LLRANGEWLQTEVIATNHVDDPQVAGLLLTIRDVSESMRTDRALRESEAHYRLIVELAQEGIWVVDEDAVTTYANRAMAEMLGTTVRGLIGRSVFEFMDEAEEAEARVELERRRSGIADKDVRLITPDGRTVWTRMNASPMRSHDGDYRGAIALVTDVTERRCLEERLAHEARVDALTGVANRNTLFDVLEVEMARRRTCGVLFADLDNFKSINDTYGHSAGDETLRVVAERIMNVIRTHDTLARVGGDEFVVVSAPVRDADEAIAISERIPPTLREPIRVGGNSIPVALSIGVAVTEDGDTSDSILARADDALYRAKRAGRSRIEVAARSSERS